MFPSVDGYIVSVATLPQRLQSLFHSFKIDGLRSTFSGVIMIDSSAHSSRRGREHPHAAEESISLLPPEIIIWKSSGLFTPVLFFFFWFKMVYAFKMSKEDLQCDINAPQCQATGTAVAWHWGFYSFKNLFKNNWILNRPAEKRWIGFCV